MSNREGVHRSHCGICDLTGEKEEIPTCKYGDEDCPVVNEYKNNTPSQMPTSVHVAVVRKFSAAKYAVEDYLGLVDATFEGAVEYVRAASVPNDKERADVPTGLPQTTALDAKRYRRLRVLGVAPGHTEHLKNGNVLRFTNLDDFVDSDLSNYVRGETALTAPDQSETIKALVEARDALKYVWDRRGACAFPKDYDYIERTIRDCDATLAKKAGV